MDATTLLGTLLGELLGGAARLAGHAAGWPSPAQLVAGSLTAGSRVLLAAAATAWVAGVFAVLVAVSGRGAAGASAPRGPRPAPPLPPRRVRAAAPEQVPERAPVLVVTAVAEAVAAPIAASTPRPAVRLEVAAAAPIVVAASSAVVGPSMPAPTSPVAAAPERAALAPEPEPVQRGAPLPSHVHGSARTAAAQPRCRRCTQPRCWPSTGERHPARVSGTGAPRACRTSLTAGTTHRCGAADPRCGRERCTVRARSHPARPAPGTDRTPALPR